MVASSSANDTFPSATGHSHNSPGPQARGDVANGQNAEQASRPLPHPDMTSRTGQMQTLWILIFKGHPQDLQSTRITQLYISFDEAEKSNVTIRIQGEYPDFKAHEEWNQPLPWLRPHYFRRLAVSTFTSTGNEIDLRVRNIIMDAPVNNPESDYNCQSWVGDVVTVLQEANLITVEEGDNAINSMVNLISQAPWR
ncbi:hypothetical protein F4808DRAFT_459300 [Astrocystis sublimbata]|nr:hypothetical protein F4808DRAFT_459300 [Astrocystis sublimbata]